MSLIAPSPCEHSVANVNISEWPLFTEFSIHDPANLFISKHMDKHDRPYQCPVEGCENLPGFTYSGGLLRHQREVHNQHGGPKNPLNCPHFNCKRHGGKGFSRLENLNEHLRRVHTGSVAQSPPTPEAFDDKVAPVEMIGEKRKAGDDELREENKRLRCENLSLREQNEAHKRQQIAMMEQLARMQGVINSRANAGHATNPAPGLSMFDGNVHQSY